jgi:hypothetical protein
MGKGIEWDGQTTRREKSSLFIKYFFVADGAIFHRNGILSGGIPSCHGALSRRKEEISWDNMIAEYCGSPAVRADKTE